MLFVDVKYAALIGGRIKNFKQKNQYVWQYTCPHCSDWTDKRVKARAYIYRKKTDLFTKCHHCGHGSNIGNLIKHFDEVLYKQYVVERYQNNVSKYSDHKDIESILPHPSTERAEELYDDILSSIRNASTLPGDHPAKRYLVSRAIEPDQEKLFYYAPRFKQWTNTIVQRFMEPIEHDHPRLIIPYFNDHGKVTMFNARAFGDEKPKYMMIRLDEEAPKVYGLDRIRKDQKIYVTEGEIDSLMLPNCVASGGAAGLDSLAIQALKSRVVLVHDNEPRNAEVGAIITKTIEQGYNMFLPPDDFAYKDLNAAVCAGVSKDQLKKIVDDNTFSGLAAQLRFTQWKKF